MEANEAHKRIIEIEREISALPEGSVTTKKVKNGTYYYHRITRNGKRKENYINAEKASEMKEQIEKRKALEKELKILKASLPEEKPISENTDSFHTYIRIGDTLKKYAALVKRYKKRDCFDRLKDFLSDSTTEKVMILYGLRRTGKTTLIRQMIANMSEEELRCAAFIQIKFSDTLADVNSDLKRLEASGYRYIFMDEVTLMKDFIEGAALFSDIFAASGMKIVLSGTDSLGFLFSEDEQLFDRCVMIHTTFIPYREFERVLGISGIDEYIRYGGTMSLSSVNYNEDSVFANSKKASEYIDSAIARNIQHSLQYYQHGSHFRSLRELFDKNELTSAIHRVIEDMNHRFTVDTLTRTFASGDLPVSAENLRRDRNHPNDILDRIDVDAVTEKIKTALEILNKEERQAAVHEIYAAEIRDYLKLLDLVVEIEIRHSPNVSQSETVEAITQPGMRYVQAEELTKEIVADSVFQELDIVERNAVLERIRSEIKGRMMEEIILLETKFAKPKMQVFKLQFAVGEFDMVVADPETLTCKIYEIRHSAERVSAQYGHLIDEQKCAETEHHFGRITGKYAIYRGEPISENGIEYLNVEEYLREL
ncbi:MAG: AAA family ATPase [Eubacteriales bacterium]|nr:AAA family ATPase [Eubacteriales bacterium]